MGIKKHNQHHQPKSKLQPFVMTALAIAVSNAWAEDAAVKNNVAKTLDAVVVTGQALSIQKSIAEKRFENVISDGVSADEIGGIPDFGLGEAVQRISGVSMLQNNNRGEAQFMSIRGFNPDYNTTLIDGIALPPTETTRRTVSLDILPSSLPRQVTIYKSLTPDMESNGIGGVADLRTRSAFDTNKLFASVKADAAYWENQREVLGDDKPSGQVEGVVSNVFGPDDQFGFVLSGNYYRRESSSLNTAMDNVNYYASPTGSGAAAFNNATAATTANGLAQRDLGNFFAVPTRHRWLEYDNVRERQGVFGKLEFDNHKNMKAHATAGFFQHRNDEFRWAQFIDLAGTINRTSPTTGSSTQGASQSDLSHFTQTRETRYLDLGGTFKPSEKQSLDVRYNVAEGKYRQDNTTIVANQAASTSLATSYVAEPGNVAVFTPSNMSALLNPAAYRLGANSILFQPEESSTLTHQYKIDFSQNMEEGDQGLGYKVGLLIKETDVNYNRDNEQYGSTSALATLSATGIMNQDFTPYNGNGRRMLMLNPTGALNFFNSNRGLFTRNVADLRNSLVPDFNIEETQKVGYALGSFRNDKWSVIAGGRYEQLDRDISNMQALNPNRSGTATDTIANYESVTKSSKFNNFLPSINVSYDVTPSFKLRTAASKSLGAPTYAQLAQNGPVALSSANLATGDGGTLPVGIIPNITVANPDLKQRQSNNYDISTEWYFADDGIISAAVFRKDIKNEIVNLQNTTREIAPFGLNGTYDITTTQAVNTDTATVNGLELGIAKTHFDFLPFPFNLFGATANATLLDMTASTIRMGDGTFRKLPQLAESPKEMANASLLFNYGKWGAQLSYNMTGKMPRSFDANNEANDIWYAKTAMLDMQIRYKLDKRTTFMFQAKNMTDEEQDRIWGPDQNLIKERFQNGRSFYLGASYVY